MEKLPRVLALLAFTLSAPLAFGAQRTFVSTSGVDTNPCSLSQPCRNFAAAIAQTATGGEVYVLDSGGYGVATITTSITIRAEGVAAGVSVFSGDGIDVNAGATDVITLHGLNVNGVGGDFGIRFLNGAALHLERITAAFFHTSGVDMTTPGQLFIDDSTMRDCAGGNGLNVHPVTGIATVSADHCRFEGNSVGASVSEGTRAVIKNSVAAGNAGSGFNATVLAATNISELTLESCVTAGNNAGVYAQSFNTTPGVASAIVRISNVTDTENVISFATGGVAGCGVLWSFGNNTITGNGTDVLPTTTISQM